MYQHKNQHKEHKKNRRDRDDIFLNEINKSLSSLSLSFSERLESVSNKIKNHYKAIEVAIILFEDEHLKIINHNIVDKNLLKHKTISFSQKNIIEQYIASDFFEQQDYKLHRVHSNIDGISISEIVNFNIKGYHNEKSLGVVSVIFSQKSEVQKAKIYDFLHLISKNIAYNTYIEREEKLFLESIRTKKREEKLEKSINNFHILNFNEIKNKLSLEIKRVERYNNTLSAINFRLHCFSKELQKLEVGVLQIIDKSTREIDMFGLWENDSYIIILPETNIFGAKQVVQKIKNKILDKNFVNSDNINFAVTEYNILGEDSEEAFVKRLQKALNNIEEHEEYMMVVDS